VEGHRIALWDLQFYEAPSHCFPSCQGGNTPMLKGLARVFIVLKTWRTGEQFCRTLLVGHTFLPAPAGHVRWLVCISQGLKANASAQVGQVQR
jgi:hypothetical protein